jgi:hypothetical protein
MSPSFLRDDDVVRPSRSREPPTPGRRPWDERATGAP